MATKYPEVYPTMTQSPFVIPTDVYRWDDRKSTVAGVDQVLISPSLFIEYFLNIILSTGRVHQDREPQGHLAGSCRCVQGRMGEGTRILL